MALSQVAGSAASTPSPLPTHTLLHPPPRILACVLCQTRKIKCDRNFPCSNCIKAKTTCTPSTPAPPRKRRGLRNLQERLAKCEALLKEHAISASESSVTPAPTPAGSQLSATSNPPPQLLPPGRLIQDNGKVRFTEDPVWNNLHDELRAMREMLDAEDSDEISVSSPTFFDPDLIFDNGGDIDLDELRPDSSQIFQLWQVFINRVNPITKVIHVPTVQQLVVHAASKSADISGSVDALLFAIYSVAAMSLNDNECLALLGRSRTEASMRFSIGARVALCRSKFLHYFDLTTLQALVIYMFSLQGKCDKHTAWTLNGLVVRLAQKLGLHRDGEVLGLPPFETEMRRRVWWAIIMLDSSYAMLSGISQSLLPSVWDTKQPQNINDADLFPTATEYVKKREGPTEMIFCLLMYNFTEFLTRNADIVAAALVQDPVHFPSHESNLAHIYQLLDQLENTLDDVVTQYCDATAGPLHEMVLEIRPLIPRVFRDIVHLSREEPEWRDPKQQMKQGLFNIAFECLGCSLKAYKAAEDRGFLWFMLSQFHVEMFLVMVGQLSLGSPRLQEEPAWELVNIAYHYHPDLLDMRKPTNQTLGSFVLKAWGRSQMSLGGQQKPQYIQRLQDCLPKGTSPRDDSSDAPSTDDTGQLVSEQFLWSPAAEPMVVNIDFPVLDWDFFTSFP